VTHTDIHLQAGDGIVLYTDGITEARNPAGAFYGIERLCAVLSDCWQQSATQIKDTVIQDLKSYVEDSPLLDDVTLLVIKQKCKLA